MTAMKNIVTRVDLLEHATANALPIKKRVTVKIQLWLPSFGFSAFRK